MFFCFFFQKEENSFFPVWFTTGTLLSVILLLRFCSYLLWVLLNPFTKSENGSRTRNVSVYLTWNITRKSQQLQWRMQLKSWRKSFPYFKKDELINRKKLIKNSLGHSTGKTSLILTYNRWSPFYVTNDFISQRQCLHLSKGHSAYDHMIFSFLFLFFPIGAFVIETGNKWHGRVEN